MRGQGSYLDMTVPHGTQHQTYVDGEKTRFEMQGFRGSIWKIFQVNVVVKLGECCSLFIET